MEGQVAKKSTNVMTWILAGCVIPVLLVLCCGVGGVLVYLLAPSTFDPVLALLGMSGSASAAKYAPEQAPLFMSANVNLAQAANFQKVWSVYEKNTQVQTSLSDFRKQFRDSTGCDFDVDVAPWLGPDVAVFFTDATNLSTSTAPRGSTPPLPNLVIAIGTRDQAKAQAAMTKCTSKTKLKSEETYKGTKVSIYDQNNATALVGSYVLLATTTDAIHAAIDASSGAIKALDKNPSYTNLIARLPANRVATLYMQVAPLFSAMPRAFAAPIQPQALAQLEAYQGMGVSLGFEPNGIRLDFTALVDLAKLPECTRALIPKMTNANQALKAAPANVLFYTSGSNLKNVWDCSLTQMDATSKKQIEDMFASVNKQAGIDINADFLGMITGEYAMAAVPAQPLSRGMPGVGVLVLIEAQDQALVNTKMTKISTALGKQGVVFKDQNIKGVTMKVATLGAPNDPAAPSVGYGTLGNFLVIAGPTDALNGAADASKTPLANDSAFMAVQKMLPAKNSGYFYANVTAIEKLLSDNMTGKSRDDYIKTTQPWLKPIKAIGAAGEANATNSTNGTFFIYISGE